METAQSPDSFQALPALIGSLQIQKLLSIYKSLTHIHAGAHTHKHTHTRTHAHTQNQLLVFLFAFFKDCIFTRSS